MPVDRAINICKCTYSDGNNRKEQENSITVYKTIKFFLCVLSEFQDDSVDQLL